jgi:hypothetical protein
MKRSASDAVAPSAWPAARPRALAQQLLQSLAGRPISAGGDADQADTRRPRVRDVTKVASSWDGRFRTSATDLSPKFSPAKAGVATTQCIVPEVRHLTAGPTAASRARLAGRQQNYAPGLLSEDGLLFAARAKQG